MKRHRTILRTLALPMVASVLVPAAAAAGGPLLSGYGAPGAGAQAIIGATLLNGPGGGSGGNSSGGESGGNSAVGSPGVGSASGSQNGAGTTSSGAGSAREAKPGSRSGRARGSSRAGSSGASPISSRAGAPAGASTGAGTSWFSGADLLAIVLAAGVLALMALATVRLGRTHP